MPNHFTLLNLETCLQSFNLYSNPLDPQINEAVAGLGDLGVTSEIFQHYQLPIWQLRNARQVAYLEQAECIQCKIGYLWLCHRQLNAEEANIQRHLTAAIFMHISDNLEYNHRAWRGPIYH
jgi:hypothetical protein